MTDSRLLSRFSLGAGETDIRCTWNGFTRTASVSASNYYFSKDADIFDTAGVDFCRSLESAFETAFAGDGAPAFDVEIHGVDGLAADATNGAGRISITVDSSTIQLLWNDGATTLPANLLGWPGGASSAAASPLVSPWCHDFGWYPAQFASDDRQLPVSDRETQFTDGGYPQTAELPGHVRMPMKWEKIPAVRVRPEAASLAAYLPGNYGLTLGDINCSWFTFWDRVAGGNPLNVSPDEGIRRVRYYRDVTDVDTYTGSWVIAEGSPLWSSPLDPPSFPEQAGEAWTLFATLRSHPLGLD